MFSKRILGLNIDEKTRFGKSFPSAPMCRLLMQDKAKKIKQIYIGKKHVNSINNDESSIFILKDALIETINGTKKAIDSIENGIDNGVIQNVTEQESHGILSQIINIKNTS